MNRNIHSQIGARCSHAALGDCPERVHPVSHKSNPSRLGILRICLPVFCSSLAFFGRWGRRVGIGWIRIRWPAAGEQQRSKQRRDKKKSILRFHRNSPLYGKILPLRQANTQKSKREPSFCQRLETEQKRNNQVLRKPCIGEKGRIYPILTPLRIFPNPCPMNWRRGWESNPPRPAKQADNGFEDRGGHQPLLTLRKIAAAVSPIRIATSSLSSSIHRNF